MVDKLRPSPIFPWIEPLEVDSSKASDILEGLQTLVAEFEAFEKEFTDLSVFLSPVPAVASGGGSSSRVGPHP